MLTILRAKKNFDKEWLWLKKKDEIAIKKVERQFKSGDRISTNFVSNVYAVYDAYKLQIPTIAKVLEDYLDNPIFNMWFDTKFNKLHVYNVLKDMQFMAMLMCNNLLKRAVNLSKESQSQLKLRVYIAILNYDRYMKSKLVGKSERKGRGRK